jgi:hypothetical protein
MNIYKSIQLKKKELLKLQEDCDDYVWAVVDPLRCVISMGDDYLIDLRDTLLVRHCQPENIFGVGFKLSTGEVDYIPQINRRNPTVDCSGELSLEAKESIERTLRYFFEKLPIYREL